MERDGKGILGGIWGMGFSYTYMRVLTQIYIFSIIGQISLLYTTSECTRGCLPSTPNAPTRDVFFYKAKHALDELSESSTDIMADNLIKRYAKRPKCLENWCLADYVSHLEVVYPTDKMHPNDQDVNDDNNDISSEELFSDEKWHQNKTKKNSQSHTLCKI